MTTDQHEKQRISALLSRVFQASDILTDNESLRHYGRDWTRLYEPDPAAVVLPRTTEQVQALVLLANEQGFSLVPSGGRTGLSGGAMATQGEVVVAFDRMKAIRGFSATDRSLVCEAGVITRDLQQYASDHGLYYPVDFASSGSSQIGGNVATNAGGIKVIRYGLTRDWVAGLTVVTGKGDVLTLNKGLVKNATGYDLRHLFIGSEGTLGFITEVTVRLTRIPQNLTVMVLGVSGLEALIPVLQKFQQVQELTAFEFFSSSALQHVLAQGAATRPMATPAPCYALLEFEALSAEVQSQMLEVFEYCMAQGWVLDGVISQNDKQARNLWRLREDISQSLAAFTPYKHDLSVTVARVPEFLSRVDQLVAERYPHFETVWYGHIGDGNLHLNILKPDDMDKQAFFDSCAHVSADIFAVVAQLEGSISAEHGIGLLKKAYLNYSRSPEELEYMRQMKQVFDPQGIMNPGKLFD